jgi:hypothetical protein
LTDKWLNGSIANMTDRNISDFMLKRVMWEKGREAGERKRGSDCVGGGRRMVFCERRVVK